ncbi:MAG: hypothetical protein QXT00_09220 [Ignisphaera sp.]
MSLQNQTLPSWVKADDEEMADHIRYIANLKAKISKDIDEIISRTDSEVIARSDVYDGVKDVVSSTGKIVLDVYGEAVRLAEGLATTSSDLKEGIKNMILIYSKVSAINALTENILRKYIFRYSTHVLNNELPRKITKIRDALKYVIEKKVFSDELSDYSYYELLEDIYDKIVVFKIVEERGYVNSIDFPADDLKTLRKMLEESDKNRNMNKWQYTVLSDILDLVQGSGVNGIAEGYQAYKLVTDWTIGSSELCKTYYDSPSKNGIFCDDEPGIIFGNEKAYQASKINYKGVMEHSIEAFTHFKTMLIAYNILRYNYIEDDTFMDHGLALLNKTEHIIDRIIYRHTT